MSLPEIGLFHADGFSRNQKLNQVFMYVSASAIDGQLNRSYHSVSDTTVLVIMVLSCLLILHLGGKLLFLFQNFRKTVDLLTRDDEHES